MACDRHRRISEVGGWVEWWIEMMKTYVVFKTESSG